ncbi:MAG: retropepsin-like aspartic protease [Candidatus Daviesbacteria bacterium]
MIFKYRKISLSSPFSRKKYLLRPIIPVSLSYKNRSIHYEALIDSGADFSIFPLEIAKMLNISLKKEDSIYFSGLGDEFMEGFKSKIILRINKLEFKTNVVFADLSGKSGILGQNGFFDLFEVKFNLLEQEIEITPYKPN